MRSYDESPSTPIQNDRAGVAATRFIPGLRETDSGVPCRCCGADLHRTFIDLGTTPLCETYVRKEDLNRVEYFYPLHVYVCDQCFLAQLEEYVAPEEIFTEYAYFSSYSDCWVEHARRYVAMVTERFGLGPESLVVELASNDGYLLQHFVPRASRCSAIEPAANVAEVAVAKRESRPFVKFFGSELAPGAGRPGDQRRPAGRQQRAGPGARPQRFRRRHEDSAQAAAAWSRSSFPTCCA